MWLIDFITRSLKEEIYMARRQINVLREEVSALREVVQQLVDQRSTVEDDVELERITNEVREVREMVEGAKDTVEEFPEPSTHGVPL